MSDTGTGIRHFILTRFNIRLWKTDRDGNPVRTVKWLEHRFELFERFCLPSVRSQTCQDFLWIVLFDTYTPDSFRDRISGYRAACPQMIPVFVEPGDGWKYPAIFREEVVSRMGDAGRVITTYLDNDDALSINFVEDLQRRAAALDDVVFVRYTDGYQYYTDHGYLMRIHYRRNHFVSVVEPGLPEGVKTIYGYGSHFYIERLAGVEIEDIPEKRMWCEVIHEKNKDNDAHFLFATMSAEKDTLRNDFALDETVKHGPGLYLFRFLPRYVKNWFRRLRHHIFGRKW